MTAAAALIHRVCQALATYTVEDGADAGRFRAKQIEAVVRMTPMILAGHWVCSSVVVATFWGTVPHELLISWLAVVWLLSINGLPTWLRWRRGQYRERVSQRAMRRMVWHAALVAAVWALVPQALLAHAQGTAELVGWVTVVSILASGIFALGTVPWAGATFIVVLTSAMLLAGGGHARVVPPLLAVVLALFAVLGLLAVWISARTLGRRLMEEARAEHQSQVVGLLLRDFAESSADLLWETDALGVLQSDPERILRVLDLAPGALSGRPLAPLLLRRMGGVVSGRRERMVALRAALSRREPFRDLTLALGRGERVVWVALTAKPKVDAQGRFAGWRGVARDVTRAQQTSQQLTFLAHHDVLTQLPNRLRFRELAAEALRSAGRSRPAMLVCLDVDHFKTTNDTLGHAAGDALLVEVARRLQACSRRGDIVARFGGDEFAALLLGVSGEADAAVLANRLLTALQQPMPYQGVPLAVRVSMGVALAPRDGQEVDVLISHADLALNEAKASGRATWRRFAADIAQHTRRRAVLEEGLRSAQAHGELWLAFQPKVALASGHIEGFEALLRWTHPELGAISPAEFIPIAEASGLIVPMGQWALGEALRAACHWPAHLSVAVNVSATQAVSQAFVQTVRDALTEHGVVARRLELEITESIFITEGEAAMAVLRQLRALGVRIALDDFGTGYSSLAYLRHFPFDTLKIDRSFMRELLTRADAQAIVTTILSLARTLNMTTVAEGVEEHAQLGALHEHGCQLAQGYWIARPMPEAQVMPFLGAWPHSPAGRALLPQQQGLTLVA